MSSLRQITIAFALLVAFGMSLAIIPIERGGDATLTALAAVDAVVEARPRPDVEVASAEGLAVSVDGFEGRIVYLNFWAQYCAPCREEMPTLNAFANAYGDRLEVVTVSTDDLPADAMSYLGEAFPDDPAFHVFFDPGGSVASVFGTSAYPETYVIGADGQMIARLVGAQDFMSEAHLQLAESLLSN